MSEISSEYKYYIFEADSNFESCGGWVQEKCFESKEELLSYLEKTRKSAEAIYKFANREDILICKLKKLVFKINEKEVITSISLDGCEGDG